MNMHVSPAAVPVISTDKDPIFSLVGEFQAVLAEMDALPGMCPDPLLEKYSKVGDALDNAIPATLKGSQAKIACMKRYYDGLVMPDEVLDRILPSSAEARAPHKRGNTAKLLKRLSDTNVDNLPSALKAEVEELVRLGECRPLFAMFDSFNGAKFAMLAGMNQPRYNDGRKQRNEYGALEAQVEHLEECAAYIAVRLAEMIPARCDQDERCRVLADAATRMGTAAQVRDVLLSAIADGCRPGKKADAA